MTAMLVLKKAWVWLKEYWQIPAVILYTIIMAIVFRRNTKALEDTLAARKESYEAQLKTLRSLHEEEIMKRDGLIEEYQLIVSKLEEDFKRKEKTLTDDHKEKVKRLLIESKEDPAKVRERIKSMFGFEYVE